MNAHYGDLPTRLENGAYRADCSCGESWYGSRLEAKELLDAHLDEHEGRR